MEINTDSFDMCFVVGGEMAADWFSFPVMRLTSDMKRSEDFVDKLCGNVLSNKMKIFVIFAMFV